MSDSNSYSFPDPSSFPPLKNDLLLRAARGEVTERAPVWIMRQAGRYLPEFREFRKKYEAIGFFGICETPEHSRDVTLQPIHRFSALLDASIIFSDILVIPKAMGMVVEMNPGPVFPSPLTNPGEIANSFTEQNVGSEQSFGSLLLATLPKEPPAPSKHNASGDTFIAPVRRPEDVERAYANLDKRLEHVYRAITATRHALEGQVPLIGFCGSPWTLFAYMTRDTRQRSFHEGKRWLLNPANSWHAKVILQDLTDACVRFLVNQVKAGAQTLQVFDSHAGEFTPHDFLEHSFPYLQQISQRVKAALGDRGVPIILFAKSMTQELAYLAEHSGYDVLSIDWVIEPSVARALVGDKVALQGNADPDILYCGREAIEKEVKRMCAGFKGNGPTKGWIANLGHGITPGVDPEALKFFLECVHKYSAST